MKLAMATNQVLARRAHDIGGAALEHAWEDRMIVAALLTRGLVETVAVMSALRDAVGAVAAGGSRETFMDTLGRLALGSRIGLTNQPAVNVLTYVDKLEQRTGPVRRFYDVLSEGAHPNAAGCLNGYARIKRRARGMTIEQPFQGSGYSLLAHACTVMLRVGLAQCLLLGAEVLDLCKKLNENSAQATRRNPTTAVSVSGASRRRHRPLTAPHIRTDI